MCNCFIWLIIVYNGVFRELHKSKESRDWMDNNQMLKESPVLRSLCLMFSCNILVYVVFVN
jgi:hypothetical protein